MLARRPGQRARGVITIGPERSVIGMRCALSHQTAAMIFHCPQPDELVRIVADGVARVAVGAERACFSGGWNDMIELVMRKGWHRRCGEERKGAKSR